MSLRLSALFLAAVFTATALADEASVRRGVETRFDGIKVDSVTKTSYGGLYEIVVGETLFYTDENVNFVFKGEIIDARSQKNLTEERQQKLTAIKFDDLPLDLAIKQVRGNGKRVVAMFSDPHCPYCKTFEQTLQQVDDITIYVFMFPVIHPELADQSKSVWCSSDRAKAWLDVALRGKPPTAPATCANPVEKNLQLGRSIGVNSTPTLILASGERVSGALSKGDLNDVLDAKP